MEKEELDARCFALFRRIQDSMQSIKTESISSLLNPNLETLNSILSSLDSLNRSLKKKKEK